MSAAKEKIPISITQSNNKNGKTKARVVYESLIKQKKIKLAHI